MLAASKWILYTKYKFDLIEINIGVFTSAVYGFKLFSITSVLIIHTN